MKAIKKKSIPEPLKELYERLNNGELSLGKAPFDKHIKGNYTAKDGTTVKIPKILQEALAKEQGYLCCYCNQSLRTGDGLKMKIEHFKPKSLYSGQPLNAEKLKKLCSANQQQEPLEDLRIDYDNLLAGCTGKHCDDHGFGKGDWELCSISNPAEVKAKDFKRVYGIFYSNTGAIYSEKRYQQTCNLGSEACTCDKTKKRQCLNWELGGCKTAEGKFNKGRLNLNADSLRRSRAAAWEAAVEQVMYSVFPSISEPSGLIYEGKHWKEYVRTKGKEQEAKAAIKKKIKQYRNRSRRDDSYRPFCQYVIYRLRRAFR